MDVISQISNKYDKYYFALNEKIKKGTKVVYIPDHHSFIYMYYEGDYVRFKFKPGDIMTVKKVKKDEPCNSVYMNENECIFSPNELLQVELVDKEDIKKIVNFYKEYKKNNRL
jgi:hypothetical protein